MGDMPKPRYAHVQRETTRHGKIVWYFRRTGGPRIRLPEPYGGPEFMAAYTAALTGERPSKAAPAHARGTFAWLIARYRQSSAWSGLSPMTRRQREVFFRQATEAAGDQPRAAITSKVIRAGRELRKATPAAANNFLKAMRALFRWALEAEMIAADPTAGVAALPDKTDGHEPWTGEDIAAFEARWPAGTRERVAMHVLLYTGLRRGDAVRLGRQHVRDGVARLAAEKTGEQLYIPIPAQLAETLARGPTGDLAFIAGDHGRPLQADSFGNWFRAACRAAGIRKSAHGLRKTLATEAANAGASEMELQALFGWRSGRTSSIYTRAAGRERLARQAAKRLDDDRSSTLIDLPKRNEQ